MTGLRFEDLQPGQVFTSPEVTLTEADILAFATEFDPQPMHVDKDFAAQGPLGGLIASGWHTASVAMRLQRETGLPALHLAEIESLAWPKPVRPGDRLRAKIEIRAISASTGRVQFNNTVVNGAGEAVQIMVGTISMQRRIANPERH